MPIAQDAPIRRVTTTLISSVCRLSRISGGKTATIAAGSCTRPTTRLTECRKDDRPRRPPSREAESFANRGRARPFRLTQRHEQPVADERQSENIAESERLGAMAAVRCAVRRSSGSGRPCARPGSAGGLGASDGSSRRPGGPAVATPMLCRVAICACSEAPRTRRASTTDTPPLVAFMGPGWTRSEVPATLCDSLLPNSCASEFRAVSARAARRHPGAVLRRHYAVRDWAPFEHLGLL